MHGNTNQMLEDEFFKIVSEAAKNAYNIAIKKEDFHVSISTPKAEFGDISSSISFRIAKELKQQPHAVAIKILEKSSLSNAMIKELKESAGYINAFIDEKKYAEAVLGNALELGSAYGSSEIGKGKKVIVEYPSVNPNKPWHIGHLKNALLGDAVANIMSFCSYDVEREDYIDDLGLQVAESLWGYINIKDKPDKKFDQWLGEKYVEVNKAMEKQDIKEEINGLLKKMEDPNTLESKTSREFAEKCVAAQYETAFNYRIYHDILIWESNIVAARLLNDALHLIKEKNIIEQPNEGKYSGCLVINLDKAKGILKGFENLEENTKVLVRSNGTATYVAKDLAFHMWKFGIIEGKFKYSKFMVQPNGKDLYTTSYSGEENGFGNADIVVNVIGSAQQYPQLVLKSLIMLSGYAEKAENLVHLSYGEVELEEGSLHGRSGGWIGSGKNYTADDLLKETEQSALQLIKDTDKAVDKPAVAHDVALGAIKFEFLRSAPEKKTIFSWDKALNFEGNSGPYCMYMFARASKIIEKASGKDATAQVPLANEAFSRDIDYSKLTRGIDFELLKLVGKAQESVEKACREFRPNVISDYLLELSVVFSRFYETMPVLKGDAISLRLAITKAAMQTIGNMLLLLGIKPIERI
ncbi:MAG: arginine--tRNA ligase [Candidatus Micrarchaeia archaeon]